MSVRMKKPSKVNIVTVLLFLLGASLLYAGIQFGPVYYRKWKVKAVLSEASNRLFPQRMHGGGANVEVKEQVRRETEQKIREIGIEDPGLQIVFMDSSSEVTIRAEYLERIEHPLIKKTTILYFRPQTTQKDIDR